MQNFYCDICKKKVDNPITGQTFYYYAEHSICEPCRDNLESQVKPAVRTKDPYSIDWYNKLIGDSLTKAIQKGKI